MRELTHADRLWLVAQANRVTSLVIPAAARERLRQMDLVTTRHNRSVSLTRLGHGLALRLRQHRAMAACSAGILLYRRRSGTTEVLLAHPGGPFWQRRDAGAWTLPKGELAAGEDAEGAARREFREELGADLAQPLQPRRRRLVRRPGLRRRLLPRPLRLHLARLVR